MTDKIHGFIKVHSSDLVVPTSTVRSRSAVGMMGRMRWIVLSYDSISPRLLKCKWCAVVISQVKSYVSSSVMPKANQLILSTTRLKSLLDKFYFPVVPWPLYRLIPFQNSPLERRFACCQSATVHSFFCEPSLSCPFKWSRDRLQYVCISKRLRS